jgi:hypothetical protein
MAVTYKESSNYSITTVNEKYLEVYNPALTTQNLSVQVNKTIIPSKYNLRPDLMAYNLYGNSKLWWVIIHYNRDVIKDPIFDFKAGLLIVVPKNISSIGI